MIANFGQGQDGLRFRASVDAMRREAAQRMERNIKRIALPNQGRVSAQRGFSKADSHCGPAAMCSAGLQCYAFEVFHQEATLRQAGGSSFDTSQKRAVLLRSPVYLIAQSHRPSLAPPCAAETTARNKHLWQ